ncbi:MAG: hypothetical protein JXA20_02875 [Spirochaetes bacterium]|nr:hypothetical protein [Spirochaetota bacterium]
MTRGWGRTPPSLHAARRVLGRALLPMVLAVSLFPAPLLAFGLGAFGTYGESLIRYTYSEPITERRVTRDHRGMSWASGIVFDSDVARDVLVNYRLHVGAGGAERRFPWQRLVMTSYSMYHAFGFSPWRNELVRLWLGPEFGYGFGIGMSNRRHMEAFGTIGVTAGINIHAGPLISFLLEGGFRYGLFAGDMNYIDGMWGQGYGWAVGAGIMFRFNDSYRFVEEL